MRAVGSPASAPLQSRLGGTATERRTHQRELRRTRSRYAQRQRLRPEATRLYCIQVPRGAGTNKCDGARAVDPRTMTRVGQNSRLPLNVMAGDGRYSDAAAWA